MVEAEDPLDSRRVWWVVGIVVVLVVLTLFGVWGRSPTRGGATRQVALAPADPSPEPELQPTQPVAVDEPREAETEPVAESEQELPPQVRRFLEANVYPPTSGRLTAGATDQLYPNQRYEKPRPLDEDGDATSVFTADRYYYTGDEVALIWLEVLEGGQPADVEVYQATARAEERGGPRRRAPSIWDCSSTVGAGVASWIWGRSFQSTTGRSFSKWLSRWREEKFTARRSASFRRRSIGFQPSSLATSATPFTTAVCWSRWPSKCGSLAFFRFDANLYDRHGEPVAFAVFKGDLAPGENWLPLEFFGKILRDQGAKGPYSVEQIRGYRFLEGQTPDRERMVDAPATHRTSPYDSTAFSDAVYTSEHKERMVQLMLEDIDAGRTLDVPAVASASE